MDAVIVKIVDLNALIFSCSCGLSNACSHKFYYCPYQGKMSWPRRARTQTTSSFMIRTNLDSTLMMLGCGAFVMVYESCFWSNCSSKCRTVAGWCSKISLDSNECCSSISSKRLIPKSLSNRSFCWRCSVGLENWLTGSQELTAPQRDGHWGCKTTSMCLSVRVIYS